MTSAAPAMLFEPIEWTPEERSIFARREPLTPSQWAEQHIQLPWGDHPGPWRNCVTPYLPGIMDTMGLAHVREVVIVAPPQTGKSQGAWNFLGYLTDRDPGPTLMIMSDEIMAGRVSEERLQPIIDASDLWSSFKTGSRDDFGKRTIRFTHGMAINLAWASSPSLLATVGYKYIHASEVEKYKNFAGKEASPVALLRKRVNIYPHTYKIILESTPNLPGGLIWRELRRCQVIMDYEARCPACGHHQVMRLGQLRWDQEVAGDPERVEAEALAWYECEKCGDAWGDAERDKAVAGGRWVGHPGRVWTPPPRDRIEGPWERPAEAAPAERPRKVGFHYSAFVSPFIPLARVAALAIRSRHEGDELAKRDTTKELATQFLAEPYADERVERQEDHILALVEEHHPRDLVPRDTACLTLAADTQARGFWYEIRAWLYGESLTSQQVRMGFVESFAALEEVALAAYQDQDGNSHRVRFGLIDAMGDKTAEVYDWCRRPSLRGIIYPSQGATGRLNLPAKASDIEFYPGKQQRIPGGVKLYRLDVHAFKDALSARLTIARDDAGAWRLHSPGEDGLHKGLLETYARHLCAETRDDRGLWHCPQGKANHFWDVAVYQVAAAHILDLKLWNRPEEQQAAPAPPPPQPREPRARPGWLNRR